MKYRTRMLLIGAAGVSLSLAFLGYDLYTQKPLSMLTRPASGTGSQEISLQAELEGKKYSLEVMLLELPYKEDEAGHQLEEAAQNLENLFLNGNQDLQHICGDVAMPAYFPDSDITIEWYLDSWEYIEPGGTLKNELLEEKVSGNVQAVLGLGGQSLTWERGFVVCPLQDPDTGQKIKMLQHQIQEAQQGQEENVILPDTVGKDQVVWYAAKDDRWIGIAVLTMAALLGMAAGRRQDEEKLQKARERSMQLAYPDIVSRLSFYMAAGISTRKAWERIVEGYEQKSRTMQSRNPAYEEMQTALYEMQSGVPETLAYERFGARCRMPSYLKLGTLLSQNLRKGTKNLAGLLTEEANEAFEDRKALAKKIGEECESKLLLPMILMLLTILIMIMYPAVISFQM